MRHRLHHLALRPKAWEEFFTAAVADPPLEPGVELVRELSEDYDVAWLTGRPERTRSLTKRWLAEHGLPTEPLYMRGDQDRRPGRSAKIDILRVLSRYHTIGVVVDDDPSVVAAVRAEGLPVRLADWLPYREPMRQAQHEEGRT